MKSRDIFRKPLTTPKKSPASSIFRRSSNTNNNPTNKAAHNINSNESDQSSKESSYVISCPASPPTPASSQWWPPVPHLMNSSGGEEESNGAPPTEQGENLDRCAPLPTESTPSDSTAPASPSGAHCTAALSQHRCFVPQAKARAPHARNAAATEKSSAPPVNPRNMSSASVRVGHRAVLSPQRPHTILTTPH